eukprot:jgi/Mesen1/10374/ME000080S09756
MAQACLRACGLQLAASSGFIAASSHDTRGHHQASHHCRVERAQQLSFHNAFACRLGTKGMVDREGCKIIGGRHKNSNHTVFADATANGVASDAASEPLKRPQYIPNRIDDPHYVRIFDTTLRDGEQSPGATLTSKEKLDIARQLAKLGVDIIEAGYPIASPDDLEAVRNIAKEVGNNIDENGYVPVICGLSRCHKADIDAAWEGVRHALRPRIHTFIATSPIHMQHKLRKTPDEVVEIAKNMVAYAKSLGCDDIEFSPEDAGRSEPEFLYRILAEVIKAGATTLNIPDTVGYTMPSEFGELIAGIKANTPGAENVIISTHCQNDLGLATANTLAGAKAGARQLEVTINGIGERAGNASLEEVVMAIKCRGKEQFGGLRTGLVPRQITLASRMVAEYTGMSVQPHKAIVGANAFAHESGIHQVHHRTPRSLHPKLVLELGKLGEGSSETRPKGLQYHVDPALGGMRPEMRFADGMLKFAGTYEIMAPEDVGLVRADAAGIVLGKHSGRHALKTRLQQLGYEIEGKELDDVFRRFKSLADKKKTVQDDDLEALLSDEVFQPTPIWRLTDLQLVGPDGVEQVDVSVGTGPVDAAYKAINRIVKVDAALQEYSMNAVTEGIDALAHTRVIVKGDGGQTTTQHAQSGPVQRSFSGSGADEDIVVASARAYISAINKMIGFSGSRSSSSSSAAEVEPKLQPTPQPAVN